MQKISAWHKKHPTNVWCTCKTASDWTLKISYQFNKYDSLCLYSVYMYNLFHLGRNIISKFFLLSIEINIKYFWWRYPITYIKIIVHRIRRIKGLREGIQKLHQIVWARNQPSSSLISSWNLALPSTLYVGKKPLLYQLQIFNH